jgi:hypothetical protein
MKRVIFLLVGCSGYALAQVDVGAIAGSVRDASGAVINGARVEARNLASNAVSQTVTGTEGQFVIPLLRPGSYTVTVESTGFKKAVRAGILIQVQDRVRLDFVLELGQITETVNVSAEAPLIETDSASTGAVVDTQKITQLPLNGRDWLRLGRMAPGVVSTYRARDRSFSANGMRSIQNTFLVDGVANVSYLRGLDDRRRDVVRPSVESLQEFKVQTSNYSAEFGQAAGAVVNATIKSGSNQFHGSLFEYGRNRALDAKPFFQPAGTDKPAFNQHQFGGSIGGRVLRDRTFFFAAYEGQRLATASPGVGNVPLADIRQGRFGTAGIFDPATTRANLAGSGFIRDAFPGSVIPASRFDPVAARLRDLWPEPNQPGAARNFISNLRRTDNSNQVDTRVDHRFGSNDGVFGRFSFVRSPEVNPSVLPAAANPVVTISNNTRGAAGAWTRNIGATMVNELRYGYNWIVFDQSTGLPLNDYGIPNSLAAGVNGPPVISVTGLSSLGTQGNVPITKESATHQILNNLTMIRGKHTVKTGVDIRLISSLTGATLSGKGSFTFNGVYSQNPQSRAGTGAPFADFLLGTAGTAQVGSRILSDERGRSYAGYFQDDWRVSDRLTLNLGVRYEVSLPFYEIADKMANFIYAPGAAGFGGTVIAGQNGQSRRLIDTDRNNFGPRFGFAWRARPNTVIRGGYGLFYGQDEGYGVVARMVGNPPFFVQVAFPGDQITPNIVLRSGFPANATDPRNASFPGAVGYPGDFPISYVQNWGMNIQQQLPGQWLLEVGYVGTRGLKLIGARDVNQPLPGPGAVNPRRPFAGFGTVRAIEPYSRSSYHGMNARLERRFANGFTILGAYTWGHVIDIASAINGEDDYSAIPQNAYNLRAERGNAAFDIRQRFSVNYIFELPFGHGKPFVPNGPAARILGGWSIAGLTEAETGRPFNVTSNRDSSNTGATARPNVLRSAVLASGQRSIDRWFDPSALAIAPDFSFGNLGRNVLFGPGRLNFDLAVRRDFGLGEQRQLQFRAELFNAFNHPQFGDPNGSIGNPLAGVINSTITGPRQIQLALRLQF